MSIFLSDCPVVDYVNCQNNDKFWNGLEDLLRRNVPIGNLPKAKSLVAALSRHDWESATRLLNYFQYETPIMFKVIQILDGPRYARQLTRQIKHLKGRKLCLAKTNLANIKALIGDSELSLSRSKASFLTREWVRKLDCETLQRDVFLKSKFYWRKICDLLHLAPSDFAVSWFTNYIFNKQLPEDSLPVVLSTLTAENITEIVQQYNIPFQYILAEKKKLLTNELLQVYSQIVPLHLILYHWKYFEPLEKLFKARFETEHLNVEYGALIDYIQTLKKCWLKKILLEKAEQRLQEFNLELRGPIAIFGDASGSMQVAVRTSTTIATIIQARTGAHFSVFREKAQTINLDSSVQDAVRFGEDIEAYSRTSPASALYPFYVKKQIVKTIIVVTDEEENTEFEGYFFAPLYKKYYREVYPARLVFISFIQSGTTGQMVQALENEMPEIEIEKFFLDWGKPDLRKLDVILNRLSWTQPVTRKDPETNSIGMCPMQ